MVVVCSFFAAGTAAVAADSPNAVAVHKRALPAAATVWCLANPKLFGIAAEAFGFEVGDAVDPEQFTRHGKDISLLQWAASENDDNVLDFEQACEAAFVASSPSGGDLAQRHFIAEELQKLDESEAGSDSDRDSESGLIGVLVGAVLAGAGGLITNHRRANHDDADRLRELDAEFQSALKAHSYQWDVPTEQSARLCATVLKDALGEWMARGGSEDIAAAQQELEKMLGNDPPCIGKPEGNAPDQKRQSGVELRQGADLVHRHVAAVADKVGRFRRLRGRELESPKSNS